MLEDNAKSIQSEERNWLLARIPEIENSIKSGESDRASAELNDFDSRLSTALQQSTDLRLTVERRRGELKERVESLATWFPDGRRMADELKDLKDDDPDHANLDLSRLDELEQQIIKLSRTPPDLKIEFSQKYGELFKGRWGTISISIRNESSFPIEIVALQPPPEITTRGGNFPLRLESSKTTLQEIGILTSFAGTLPIDIQILTVVPWERDEKKVNTKLVLSAREPVEIGRHSESATIMPSTASITKPQNCSKCGQSLKVEWKKCPFCGTLIPSSEETKQLVCPHCGKPIRKEWKKCPYCANPLY
jgi:hypothetical protein